MQTIDTPHELLGGFECADEVKTKEKIKRFMQAGLDNVYILFDFDRTMTVGEKGDDDATTWHILQRHLPPEGKQAYHDQYLRYRQLEIDGTMTEADASVWWRETLALYVHYGVDLNRVEEDFLSVVALRPGTKELLQWCAARRIPAAILSAGIKDVIQILLKYYDVHANPIVSTQLTVDEAGVITGWQDDTLVHVLNKREAGHTELKQIRVGRPYCILIGDSMDDADMVAGDTDVLRIRVVDPRPDEAMDMKTSLRQTFQKFDLAVTTGTLNDVTTLLHAFED